MNETDTNLSTYLDLADRFSAVTEGAGGDSWQDPSPCDDWTAADVVSHVVDTQRDFFGRHDLDLGPRSEGAPDQLWRDHVAAVRQVLQPEVLTRSFDGYFGPATIGETVASFYGFDLIVHRWDLARATGQEGTFSDSELDRIERSLDGFGENLYADGVCKPAVAVPDDAPRQDRLLGRMGRDPR